MFVSKISKESIVNQNMPKNSQINIKLLQSCATLWGGMVTLCADYNVNVIPSWYFLIGVGSRSHKSSK